MPALLRVRLTPRGGRNALERFEEDVLFARVAAAPVDGGANAALIALLSNALGVRKSAIIIVSGETSRDKRVEIADLTADELTERISSALPEGRR